MKHRVFAMGIGIISGFGYGRLIFWDQLIANRTAVRASQRLKALGFASPMAAEIPGISPAKISHGGDLLISLSIPALVEALAQSALSPRDLSGTGFIMGTSLGGNDSLERMVNGQSESLIVISELAERLTKFFKLSGPMAIASAACAASAHAVSMGFDLVHSGALRACVVGGVDPLVTLTMAGFTGLKVVSKRGARPLDTERDGLSLGEAACYLVLVADTAVADTARTPLAEVLGYGSANDAYHPTSPHPEGLGAELAMKRAMNMAMLDPEDTDYINLHGTGTVVNDAVELMAVSRVFTNFRSPPPPVSSIKGAIGHTLGTAGAIELAATVMALDTGVFPGTFGLMHPMAEARHIPMLRSATRLPHARVALSNSFAFGGHSATIAVRKTG